MNKIMQHSDKQLHLIHYYDKEIELSFYGYKDDNDNVVIKPIYQEAWDFSDGLAHVAKYSGNHGFINTSGEMVISLKKDVLVYGDFQEGLCVVRAGKGHKAGFIDRIGAMVIPPKFDGARGFDHGVAPVSKGDPTSNSWGIIDRTGKFIIQPKYKIIDNGGYWSTEDGLIRLLDGDETCYFDLNGKQVQK